MSEDCCKNCERLTFVIEDLEEQVFNLEEQVFNLTKDLQDIGERAQEIKNISEFNAI